MGFWRDFFGWPTAGELSDDFNPGDPDGVEFTGGDEVEDRAFSVVVPRPWDGWPADWGIPQWDMGSRFNELVDVAWSCMDLNASVLSTMPVYRTRDGQVISSTTWMINPDPNIYSSWEEFAKQLFWDYQLGEAFVLPTAWFADGLPMHFRVIPPWMMHVEMRGVSRLYRLGSADVTSDILHIRYKSTTTEPRGVGPLESAGARMLTAGVLARYVREIVTTGGIDDRTLETPDALTAEDAQDLLNQWVAARKQNLGAPPVLDNGVTLKTHQRLSPRDMAMLEIAQFTEGRIAVLLGVPPFLVGLPSGGDSMIYSNVSSLFDFHDRASLRPKSRPVMAALSNWALPRGQSVELNRDEYTRPAFTERADAWVKLVEAGIATADEARAAERLTGEAPTVALTGGDQ